MRVIMCKGRIRYVAWYTNLVICRTVTIRREGSTAHFRSRVSHNTEQVIMQAKYVVTCSHLYRISWSHRAGWKIMEIIQQFRLIVGSQAINAQLKILLISQTVPIEYGRALHRGSRVYLYRREYRFFNRSPRRHRHACDHASGENKRCRLVNKYG